MLTLTQKQMDAFDAMQIHRFKDTMLAHFAEHFSDETSYIDKQVQPHLTLNPKQQ